MSTLLVEEVASVKREEFYLNNTKRYTLAAIYPHLYLHNLPSGSFAFSLKKSGVTIFSKEYTATEMKIAAGTALDYDHFWMPVIPDEPIQLDGGYYQLELLANNYAYSDNNFIGWCRNFEAQDYSNVGSFNQTFFPMQIKLKIKE